jgi:septum formation protein
MSNLERKLSSKISAFSDALSAYLKDEVSKVDSRLILASMSPRRVELLRKLHIPFQAIPSNIEETIDPGLSPDKLVIELARQKAVSVYDNLLANDPSRSEIPTLVLAGDTTVVLDGIVFGKPDSPEDACSMLKKLSGRCHEVYTGVYLLGSISSNGSPKTAINLSAFELSRVYFRNLEEREIEAYVNSGESIDKAGAYGLQGTGAAFVEKIDGCYTNVIGLPVPKVVAMLRQAGISILGMP